jgi:hypothetical protein
MFQVFSEEMRRQDSELNGSKYSQNLICFFISFWIKFWSLSVILKYLSLPHFQRIYYQSVNYDFILHSGGKTTIYLVFSVVFMFLLNIS